MDSSLIVPKPPDDLKFRKMIIEVGRELDKQPNILKELLSKHQCTNAWSGIQFLRWLMTRADLSRKDLYILKDTLLLLNRKDLLKLAIYACHSDGNKVNFSDGGIVHIPEGCVQVKIFFTTTSIDMLFIEGIRSWLSHALLIPFRHVQVLAIHREPSSVIFSIPEFYRELTSDEKFVFRIGAPNVVGVEVDNGQVIAIPDAQTTTHIRGELSAPSHINEHSFQHAKAELQQEVAELTQTLEEACEENVKLQKKLQTSLSKQKAFAKLHESSGMSTTLWKVTGQLDDSNDRPMYPPKKSHEEIMKETMHAKIRRVYPQIENTPVNERKLGLVNLPSYNLKFL
ncbi:uncharacterized protein LOC127831733 isoform X2 [Dreissena polymorpha]|uniref:DED domain-containing protein n=1 Tax=Dreissena polymorpha TaxID=45954 RepID=A0A9D4GSR4_DREPO|nr:uncharacterized protein LOC127831733 isoform X2 [Dreissena polymorpha]KAH3822252.1 hypothetical protein DPMN_124026 [Dreissena polymorpha]